ncbi:MAG: HNH endonuclease signature motif containing protein [Myxococcales bacterium]
MNERYRLGGLGDGQLLAGLSALVKRENDSLSDLLAHLAELEERELCLALGYSSLFAYCTEALGFCRSSAGRRIAGARVCRDFPEAFTRVARGELQLSVLCALRPHLNAENASELFAACSGKSYEHVELLLAARFPKPDVRDLIRRLPEPAVGARNIAPDVGSEVVPQQVAPVQTELSPAQRGSVKPLSVGRFRVNFTADTEFQTLLEEVRALLSHAEPSGDLLTVMKRGLEVLRGELLKKRFAVGRKPRRVQWKTSERRAVSGASEGSSSKSTRHVPAAVPREVYVRDQGRCTFCADNGRRCGERRFLQVDHVVPHAEGGAASIGNLRLRCRAHNLYTARTYFGRECVRAAAERASESAQHAV